MTAKATLLSTINNQQLTLNYPIYPFVFPLTMLL